MPAHYIFLMIAVLTETIGTTALQASHQLTRPVPTAIMLIGYTLSFYFMSLALKVMPLGVVYAIWSGLGIVLIGGMGWLLFGQRIDLPAALGMGLIIAGIVIIHLFSKATPH
ncbi:transporter [Rhodovulum sp. NI22]|jgi:small multidrug resistance pump|nr:transporter [Rhodovulum sp. NI22]